MCGVTVDEGGASPLPARRWNRGRAGRTVRATALEVSARSLIYRRGDWGEGSEILGGEEND